MQALVKRHIKTGTKYDPYFDKAKFATINLPKSDVYQTLEYMEELVRSTTSQTERFAKLFPNKNLNATCKGLFQFIYDHVQYKPDKQGVEELRSPSRSWAERTTGVDCDCYSIIISSILTNLKIPHAFRMTKYNGKENFQHVYVIVPKDGKTIGNRNTYYVIDPVLDNYNQEKPFSQKHDKMIKIPHQVLSGVHDAPISYTFGNEFNHLSGLGNVEEDFLDSTKSHLVNTLEQLNRNPKAFAITVEPEIFKAQLEYVLENWNDPVARQGALEEMAEMEELGENEPQTVVEETEALSGVVTSLIRRKRDAPISIRGARKKIQLLRKRRRIQKRVVPATIERGTLKKEKQFKATCSCDMVNGLEGYFDGLGFLRRKKKKKKGGFFKRVWGGVKNAAKKVGSGVKKAAKKVGQAAKKVGKAIVRFNPLTVAARNGLLLVMKLNLFGLAKKLKYGYLTEQQARAKNMNIVEWRKIHAIISKMERLFVKVGGKAPNLRKAILTGKAGGIDGLGEPITAAASTAAASGLIAAIKAWLKKINFKNLFGGARNFFQQRRNNNGGNNARNRVEDFLPSGDDFSTQFNDDDIILNQDLDEVEVFGKRKDPDPSSNPNKNLMIGLAAAAGIGALLLMSKKKEESPQEESPKEVSLNGAIESIAL